MNQDGSYLGFSRALAAWEVRLEAAWPRGSWRQGTREGLNRRVQHLAVWPGELRAWVKGATKRSQVQVVGSCAPLEEGELEGLLGHHEEALREYRASPAFGLLELEHWCHQGLAALPEGELRGRCFPEPGEAFDLYCTCADPAPRCVHQATVLATWLRTMDEYPTYWVRWLAPPELADSLLGPTPHAGVVVDLGDLRLDGEVGPGEVALPAPGTGAGDGLEEAWTYELEASPLAEGALAGADEVLAPRPSDPFWAGDFEVAAAALRVWSEAAPPQRDALEGLPGAQRRVGKKPLGSLLRELVGALKRRARGG